MLTTCPRCAHTYTAQPPAEPSPFAPPSSRCCHSKPTAAVSPRYVNQPPRTYVNQAPAPDPAKPRCVLTTNDGVGGGISLSLHLPPSCLTTVSITASSTPSVTVKAFTGLDTSHRVLAAMAGGGIVDMHEEFPCKSEPSPSVPLSFVLPPPPSPIDLTRLACTMDALRMSGWYYEGLSWQASADLLRGTQPGTFLVRDSSDPRFLFSLSVQTDRGPTSVRLHHVCGQFRLDAEQRLAPLMPTFDCVVTLVEHYIQATRDSGYPKGDKDEVWVDARGHMYSHILLTTPLYRASVLPSLQHLARLAINVQLRKRSSQGVGHLPLPEALKKYLKEYPHVH